MNLKEFKERLDFLCKTRPNDLEQINVCITVSGHSIGGRPYSDVERVYLGFDWEHNQLRIEPEKELTLLTNN